MKNKFTEINGFNDFENLCEGSSKSDNKKLYQKTFSQLHTDHTLNLEVSDMKKGISGLRLKRSFVIVTVVLTLILAMSCIGYAATDGQIFSTVKLWINEFEIGDANAILNQDGSYTVEVESGDKIVTESDGYISEKEFGSSNCTLDVKNNSGENNTPEETITYE